MLRRTVLPLLLGCLLLTGCTGGSGPSAQEPTPVRPLATGAGTPGVDYVALGDSYSAGPLVSTVRSDPSECLRSTDNYPAFLADWLEVRTYRDVTCSGAATTDLTGRQRLHGGRTVPPQLAALSRGTDLVTIGIGGNDFDIFARISGCAAPTGGSCALDPAALVRDAARVADRVEGVLMQVRRRSPEAEVYVVGYPQVVPERGTCPRLGLSAAGAAAGARVTDRLNASLAAAARAAEATYVSLAEVSRGHDVCAGDRAWVNGAALLPGRAAPFHPFLAGMRGAAGAVHRVLTGEAPPQAEGAEPDPAAVIRNPVRR